jgi:SAM-dependent methyltransferase
MNARIREVLTALDWRALAIASGRCTLCGPSLFVRLRRGDFGTRCARCGAAENTVALVAAIRERLPDLSQRRVQIVSMGGPYLAWVRRQAGQLEQSQYFDGVAPGTLVSGVRCENLEALTYADASFDLVTNSEVLEHVADDHRALQEVHRVLRPGGWYIFTVPLDTARTTTIERARLDANGNVEHLTAPEYHGDPVRGAILAFRTYGTDILTRLARAGFAQQELCTMPHPTRLTRGRAVICASKT